MSPHELRLLATCFDLSRQEDRGRSARWLAAFYFELVALVRPAIVAEMGAFEARFSRELRAKLPETRAVAFEANPYVHAQYSGAAVSAGVDYRHLALSDADGEALFNVRLRDQDAEYPKAKPFDSLLERDLRDVEYERVAVPTARADTVFSAPPYDTGSVCLWIDVEGAAGAVLAGAPQLLGRTETVMIEVEDLELWRGQLVAPEIHQVLSARGLVAVARDFEYPRQYNVMYVRESVAQLPGYDALVTHWYSRCATTARRSSPP